MDLSILNTPDIQSLYHKARSATDNNRCLKVLDSVFSIFSGVLSIVMTATVLANVEPWVLVVLLLAIVLKSISTILTKKQQFRNWEMDRELQKELLYHMDLLFDEDCAEEMRMTGLSAWIRGKYINVAKRARKIEENEFNSSSKNKVVNIVLTYLQEGFLYGFLAYKVFFTELTLSEFSVFFLGITNLTVKIEDLVNTILDTGQNILYLTSYIAFMKVQNAIAIDDSDHPSFSFEIMGNRPLIFHNVSFKYPGSEEYALKNVSFELDPGKFYMIVGENGAGKSTLIKLLCRLYDPTEGAILWGEDDIREYDYASYRNKIGVVFQNYMVYEYSVAENIAMNDWKDDEETVNKVWHTIDEIHLTDKIKSLPKGINTVIGRSFDPDGVLFSGGETQKIALAKALYREKTLLILDEPSSALDPIAEDELVSTFFETCKGQTVFYISHRLSAAKRADKIIFMGGHGVIDIGTHDSLITRCPAYRTMYDAQAKHYQ